MPSLTLTVPTTSAKIIEEARASLLRPSRPETPFQETIRSTLWKRRALPRKLKPIELPFAQSSLINEVCKVEMEHYPLNQSVSEEQAGKDFAGERVSADELNSAIQFIIASGCPNSCEQVTCWASNVDNDAIFMSQNVLVRLFPALKHTLDPQKATSADVSVCLVSLAQNPALLQSVSIREMEQCIYALSELMHTNDCDFKDSVSTHLVTLIRMWVDLDQRSVHELKRTERFVDYMITFFEHARDTMASEAVTVAHVRLLSKLSDYRFFDDHCQTAAPLFQSLIYFSSRLRKNVNACLRLVNILANVTSADATDKRQVGIAFGGCNTALDLFDYFMTKHKRPESSPSKGLRLLLTRIVRLIANLVVDKRCAEQLCSDPRLLQLAELITRNQDEELLLNVVAALNNFSYYIDLEGNMVITIRKELFQVLMTLVQTPNRELRIEVLRTLGNLFRMEDICTRIAKHGQNDFSNLFTWMECGERDTVLAACGCLINLSVVPSTFPLFAKFGPALFDMLQLAVENEQSEVIETLMQILYNLFSENPQLLINQAIAFTQLFSDMAKDSSFNETTNTIAKQILMLATNK